MCLAIPEGTRVLFLGPHTDDIEFAAGGVAARLLREGCYCMYVCFSDCRESIPAGFPEDVLDTEARAAAEVLGFSAINVHIERFPVRYFDKYRQPILEYLVQLRREFAPDVVFAPSMNDIHQDHEVIARESRRAFKASTMLGYEVPWNNIEARHDCFIEVTNEDLENKIMALSKFNSQKFRSYFSDGYVNALAMIRGQQAGYRWAEAFSTSRIKLGI